MSRTKQRKPIDDRAYVIGLLAYARAVAARDGASAFVEWLDGLIVKIAAQQVEP